MGPSLTTRPAVSVILCGMLDKMTGGGAVGEMSDNVNKQPALAPHLSPSERSEKSRFGRLVLCPKMIQPDIK